MPAAVGRQAGLGLLLMATWTVAVAGGLLLIQEMGGGRYTVDEFMKKRS